jgi:hypothetical protein
VSGRDKARNTAPGTKGTIKQSARDATGKPQAEEMEQGGLTRAQNFSIGAPPESQLEKSPAAPNEGGYALATAHTPSPTPMGRRESFIVLA